jgi:sulfur-oxidizing protein SoxY
MKRRQVLRGAFVLIASRAVHAADVPLPSIPSMASWLGGRAPGFARIKLDLPSIADNGFAVPMKITVAGPFAPGPYVKSIRLFSETNPVPDMAVFDFAQQIERVEIDSRVRLAGTQQVVAIAEMTDGSLLASVHEVIVTLAGCMDGT